MASVVRLCGRYFERFQMLELELDLKWMTAAQLIELLSQLKPDRRVSVNSVGNLSVFPPDGWQLEAFIDFVDPSIDYFEDLIGDDNLGSD